MLNPFLRPVPTQENRKKHQAVQQLRAEMYGHSLDTASPRPTVGLLVGKLLIRMGEKLAKEDDVLKSTRQGA